MNDLTTQLSERYTALKNLRAPFETIWQECADYIMPRRQPGMDTCLSPSTARESRLFDITAVQANMTLANGQLAWMSPMETAWFAFEPPAGGDDPEAREWLAECTQITQRLLATSNFYLAVHEFYLDRSGFGTACLYAEPGRKSPLNFMCWTAGSYVIDEDADGNVDTVFREFFLTPRQAAQKFGEENLSAKLREALAAGGAKAQQKFKFLHAIFPREDRDPSKREASQMPIASIYLERDGNHIVFEGGYEEMPAFVSRYLEWGSATGSLYGWSPAWAALPEARQLNHLQKMADALAEKMAFPPILAPEEMEGEVDANANGITYFSQDLVNRLPRPLNDRGSVDAQLERIQERQKAVREAFHVDLFQMFAQLEKQMTAREVAERSQEKLIQFSPTFARMTTELFNPLLARVFSILLRAGQYPAAPESLAQAVSETEAFIPVPAIEYSSRIALALRSLPTLAYHRTIERVGIIAGLGPDVLDNYDLDASERATALADGIPPKWLAPEAERDKSRAARAEAASQAASMEQQIGAAKALADVGSIKPDSVVGRALPGGMAA